MRRKGLAGREDAAEADPVHEAGDGADSRKSDVRRFALLARGDNHIFSKHACTTNNVCQDSRVSLREGNVPARQTPISDHVADKPDGLVRQV